MIINWGMVGASILPNLGGWAGGILTAKNIKPWYESLNKPVWRPPNWAFGPVWTTLYTSMGYASYLVYRDGGGFDGPARVPLAIFGTQLALNWAWTPIFFHFHQMGWALAEILVLYGTVAGCAIEFWKINPIAGGIMIPYLVWLTLASALNYTIWRDNHGQKKSR